MCTQEGITTRYYYKIYCELEATFNTEHHLLERKGLLSARVGNTFSFADREMKNINGTNHTHIVKYAKTCNSEKN